MPDHGSQPGANAASAGAQTLSICWYRESLRRRHRASPASCDDLEHVDLMGTQTGDGALAALAGKARLASLSTGRLVSDAGIAMLREFPVFRQRFAGDVQYQPDELLGEADHLLLDGPFTDAGLAALAGLEGQTSASICSGTRPASRLLACRR